MKKFHGTEISFQTLKRRLAQCVLKKASTDIDETLCAVIEREFKGPSSLKCFQKIWNKIRVTYGITVPRDRVMYLLRFTDLTNSAMRQTKTIGQVSLLPYKRN